MKEKIDNIIKIIKDNSKIIVPAIVAIVLLVSLFITLYFYKYNSYHKDEELVFYHYISGYREEFDTILSRDRYDKVISFEVLQEEALIDSYPMYNDSQNLILFPSRMSVIYAANNILQRRTNENAYLYYIKNEYKLMDDKFNDTIDNNFLYDGKNLYFFMDEVTLKVDDREINLSPLSFIVANPNNNVSYYDRDSDKGELIDTNSNDVIVSNEFYTINVMDDSLDYYGRKILIIDELDYLKDIE